MTYSLRGRSVVLLLLAGALAWPGAPLPRVIPRRRLSPTLPPGGPRMMSQMGRSSPFSSGDAEFPPLEKVTEGYEKVVSTADGQASLYTLWVRRKDGQMLAELPRNFAMQKQFIAMTVASGELYAGLQAGDIYAYWKPYDRRLALIEPNVETRSKGDNESKSSVQRLFTDRVILDVPIVTFVPRGGPVIDLDELLVGNASKFFGPGVMISNPRLSTVKTAKAFPNNVEIGIEVPTRDGRLQTLHYSDQRDPRTHRLHPPRGRRAGRLFHHGLHRPGQVQGAGDATGPLHQPLAGGEGRPDAGDQPAQEPDRLLHRAHHPGPLPAVGPRRAALLEQGVREGGLSNAIEVYYPGRRHRRPHGQGPRGRPLQLRPLAQQHHRHRDRPEPERTR